MFSRCCLALPYYLQHLLPLYLILFNSIKLSSVHCIFFHIIVNELEYIYFSAIHFISLPFVTVDTARRYCGSQISKAIVPMCTSFTLRLGLHFLTGEDPTVLVRHLMTKTNIDSYCPSGHGCVTSSGLSYPHFTSWFGQMQLTVFGQIRLIMST